MIRIVVIAIIFLGCHTPTPKPKAQFGLEYPSPEYTSFKNDCAYQFENNQLATLNILSSCGATLEYTTLNATLYLTYFDLRKASLDTLLRDFDKRLEMFGKEAFKIEENAFENRENFVYGSCVTLLGDSPSNLHFFGTDTQKHYLAGSLLFESAPNYDSLSPAIAYIKTDVQKLLETLRWN